MSLATRRRFLATTAAATLALAETGRAAEKPEPLRILFFGGDLPAVRKDLEEQYVVEPLTAGVIPDKKDDNVAGLEQLAKAHLWVGSIAKRTLPGRQQLRHFQDYLAAGKPIVGYRAASHVFQNWLQIDREVFGMKYGVHHLSEKDPHLQIEVAKNAKDHPLLKGLEPPPPRSGSYIYTEPADDVEVLLYSGLPGDMMPHTWTRVIKKTGNRVFYTRYDAKDLAGNATCRALFLRGLAWSLAGELEKHRKG
jgi:hypothetical protein